MGRDNSVISSSITSIKNIEIYRLKVLAKEKGIINNSPSPKINLDEEAEDVLDACLNHVYWDFEERMHEEGFDHICCELNAVSRRKKSGKKEKGGIYT